MNPARSFGVTLLLVLALGTAIRLYPSAAFDKVGFDEFLYTGYVAQLDIVGVLGFPAMTERYIEVQSERESAILPPTRFLYIFLAHVWRGMSGVEPLVALHNISCFFSILTLFMAAAFAWRAGGPAMAIGVTALMSFAPTQIHMSQHALIDGFFAFWALLSIWSLWENLKRPDHWGWLTLYALSLALMVLTKENAFFAYLTILGLLALNLRLRFGTVTPRLLLLTVAGPLLGMAILVNLAGGIPNFITVYKLLVEKAYNLQYAILTGDGPWYRYIVDLTLVSPIVVLLAVGNIFQLDRAKKTHLYFTCFIVVSYVLMANVKYGMNLRYTNMWDMPLRFLAFTQLMTVSRCFGRRSGLALVLLTTGLCALELRQYQILFVENPLYELVSEGLLRALLILK